MLKYSDGWDSFLFQANTISFDRFVYKLLLHSRNDLCVTHFEPELELQYINHANLVTWLCLSNNYTYLHVLYL